MVSDKFLSYLNHQPAQPARHFKVLQVGLLSIIGLLLGGVLSACSDLPTANLFAPATPSFEQSLAQHLQSRGATMYGAYWCPHCADQKAMFGGAASKIPYVECDAEGILPQPQLCEAKQIQGYPTWEIEGKLYPGVRSLTELATLSNYEALVPVTELTPLEAKP